MNFEFYKESNFKETEIGKIPNDWELVKLGSFLNKESQFEYRKLQSHSKIAFIPMSVIPEDRIFIDTWLYKSPEEIRSGIPVSNGDLLIAKITPCFENGKQGIVRNLPEGFAYATTEVIPINLSSSLTNVFLAYYLKTNSVRYSLAQKMEGSTGRKRLHKSQIENLLIPLPPLSEQKAIAEVLQIIQDAKEKTEEVIRATKELKKSMMKHLFTYGPVALRDSDKIEVKYTEIGVIPKNWQVVRLGDIAKFTRGISWRKSEETSSKDGKLIVSIPNIENGRINFNSKYNHYIKKEISEEKKLSIGDIVFVGSSGNIKNVGRNAIIDWLPFENVGFASFTFKATPQKDKVYTKFFYYLANSDWFKYEDFCKRASDGKYNFQLSEFIRETRVPLPPLSEQKAIAEILQTIDEKIQREEAKKQAIENLFKSMLNELMNGRLRVRKKSGEE